MPPKPVSKSSSTGSLSVISAPAKPSTSVTKSSGLTVFKSAELTAANAKREEERILALVKVEVDDFFSFIDQERFLKIEEYLSADQTSRDFKFRIIIDILKHVGLISKLGSHIINEILRSINLSTDKCENSLVLFQMILKSYGKGFEPFSITLIPKLLDLHVDKVANIRDLSAIICKDICELLCPQSFRIVYPTLCTGMENENWKIKVGALNMIKTLASRMSRQLSSFLPQLIPRISECVYDSKKQVQTVALEAMNEACLAITNEDIRPIVPQLVSVIAKPEESIATLNLLLETTFVATVDAAVLALIAPLLGKSLKNRSSVMKRKASKVIDIMCRLVQNPYDVAPFKDMLLPYLDKVIDEIVDAEVCDVAKAAREILLQALGEGTDMINNAPQNFNEQEVQSQLLESLYSVLPSEASKTASISCKYISQLCTYLILYEGDMSSNSTNKSSTEVEETQVITNWREKIALTLHSDWKECSVPYLNVLGKYKSAQCSDETLEEKGNDLSIEMNQLNLEDSSEKISLLYRTAALNGIKDRQDDVDEEGSNLCNIEFSLAFGGKILLHNTYLRLGRGRRYGVMGKNGAGKTTLLTNIGSGNIEGLPTSLKTVYVQHDDASEDGGVSLINELLTSKEMVSANVQKEDAVKALKGNVISHIYYIFICYFIKIVNNYIFDSNLIY